MLFKIFSSNVAESPSYVKRVIPVIKQQKAHCSKLAKSPFCMKHGITIVQTA
jgi:hypothetical protein